MQNIKMTNERRAAFMLQDQYLIKDTERQLEYVVESDIEEEYHVIVSEGYGIFTFYNVSANYVCDNDDIDEIEDDFEREWEYQFAEDIFDNYPKCFNPGYSKDERGLELSYSEGRTLAIFEELCKISAKIGDIVFPTIETPRGLEMWIKAASANEFIKNMLSEEGLDESKRKYTPAWSYKLVNQDMADNLGQNLESLQDMLKADLDFQNMFV